MLCVRLFFVRALREDHLDKVQWALFERCLSKADAHVYMHARRASVRVPAATPGGTARRLLRRQRRPCPARTTQTSEARVRAELTLLRRNNLPPTLFGPFPSAFCLGRACLRVRGSKQIFKFLCRAREDNCKRGMRSGEGKK